MEVRRVGDIPVLCPEGRITIGSPSIALKAALESEIQHGALNILFDGSRVEYLDSSGLAELIAAARTLTERGGRLAVSAPSHKVREVLEITGLERVFLVGDDEAAVLRELAKQDP
jgi:anti-sigma B factor antagonist